MVLGKTNLAEVLEASREEDQEEEETTKEEEVNHEQEGLVDASSSAFAVAMEVAAVMRSKRN